MKWTKQRLNNLFFFLGIAAVVVMLFTFDVSFIELWDHLCHAGYWLIPIIGIWVVVYWLNALAWQSMIEGNIGGTMPHLWVDWEVSLIASWNYRRISTISMPRRVSSSMP